MLVNLIFNKQFASRFFIFLSFCNTFAPNIQQNDTCMKVKKRWIILMVAMTLEHIKRKNHE